MSEIEILEMIVVHLITIQQSHNDCMKASLDELLQRIVALQEESE